MYQLGITLGSNYLWVSIGFPQGVLQVSMHKRQTFSDSLSILKLLKFPFYSYLNRHRDKWAYTHPNAVSPLKVAWNLCIFPSDFCKFIFSKLNLSDDSLKKSKYKRSVLFPLHSLWREITIYCLRNVQDVGLCLIQWR